MMPKSKKITLAIALFCTGYLASGCASGFEKTLNYAHKAGQGLRETGLPLITVVCEDEIAKCEAAMDPDCPRYFKCKDIRQKVALGFLALQMSILDADAAMAIGEEEAADAVGKVLDLLMTIRKQLAELEIF